MKGNKKNVCSICDRTDRTLIFNINQKIKLT
jgi:hypothetical protein